MERDIVNRILKWLLSEQETNAFKVHGNQFCVGQPDILGCRRGQMFAIEVKQPGKKPTPIQKARLREWEMSGAVAGVATSLSEAKKIIDILDSRLVS
jgi:Holliday junction resolvase